MTLSVGDVPFVWVPFSDTSLVPPSDIGAAQNMQNQGNLTASWLTSQTPVSASLLSSALSCP